MNLAAQESIVSATPPVSRLAWIDWMRGLACVLMFQTHCYDAWLGGDARNTSFLKGSQLLGTLPAPLFLFLAGVSFALVINKFMRKNLTAWEITRKMALHGAQILAFGLLFRLQEFVIAWGWAPWSDLLRVDILNIIGVSMMLMALTCGITLAICGKTFASDNRRRCMSTLAIAAVAVASVIAMLTPPLYTAWRPTWLPWWLESYIDGCHNLGTPQPWLFPLFPWAAFAFAGLAAGFVILSDLVFGNQVFSDQQFSKQQFSKQQFSKQQFSKQQFSKQAGEHSAKTLGLLAAVGASAILVAYLLDHSSCHLYSTYDYWHTSPNFLMMRVGLLLVIAFMSYSWCQWGLATRGFSPLIQLGQTSLLVYWVHIEFVYGRFSLLPKRAESIAAASRGLLEITIFMLILSLLRTRIDWKKIDWKRIRWKMTGRVQPA
jgi:uncharacterized membrane protein